MKVRITTSEKDVPESKSEFETDLPLHQFILNDMGNLYPNMEELAKDFDAHELREGYVMLKNDNPTASYQHIYEVIG